MLHFEEPKNELGKRYITSKKNRVECKMYIWFGSTNSLLLFLDCSFEVLSIFYNITKKNTQRIKEFKNVHLASCCCCLCCVTVISLAFFSYTSCIL